jgi:hypothetical protein
MALITRDAEKLESGVRRQVSGLAIATWASVAKLRAGVA